LTPAAHGRHRDAHLKRRFLEPNQVAIPQVVLPKYELRALLGRLPFLPLTNFLVVQKSAVPAAEVPHPYVRRIDVHQAVMTRYRPVRGVVGYPQRAVLMPANDTRRSLVKKELLARKLALDDS
jgi:hypothetical protein